MEVKKLSSNYWYQILYPNEELIILDPDGWDRANYDYSWSQEEITKEEFDRRVSLSTVRIKQDPRLFVAENEKEMKRLYDWIMDENRRKAGSFFTEGWTRNVAKEIEYRLTQNK